MESRYGNIKFVFEGYAIDIDIETFIADNKKINILSGMPSVFTKKLHYGLGLAKDYRFIAEIPKQYFENCDTIIFSIDRETGIDGNSLIINDNDLEKLRKGINNIHNNYLEEAKESKEIFVYNELLNKINPKKYTELKKTVRKEVIYKFLKNTDFSKSKTSQNDKQVLLEYKNLADFSYVQVLEKEFVTKIIGNHEEKTYQKFFEKIRFYLQCLQVRPMFYSKIRHMLVENHLTIQMGNTLIFC